MTMVHLLLCSVAAVVCGGGKIHVPAELAAGQHVSLPFISI